MKNTVADIWLKISGPVTCIALLVSVDASHPSQQFFRHVDVLSWIEPVQAFKYPSTKK